MSDIDTGIPTVNVGHMTSYNHISTHLESDIESADDRQFNKQPIVHTAPDLESQRFPFSIVWGPLPVITWIIPCIGHLGIGDSTGRIHDFHGPYYCDVDRFMTGRVYKYYPLSLFDLQSRLGPDYVQKYDAAVRGSNARFGQTMHNLISNNCHHHVAHALSTAGTPTTMLQAWWLITLRGQYTSPVACVLAYLPFLILVTIIVIAVTVSKYT